MQQILGVFLRSDTKQILSKILQDDFPDLALTLAGDSAESDYFLCHPLVSTEFAAVLRASIKRSKRRRVRHDDQERLEFLLKSGTLDLQSRCWMEEYPRPDSKSGIFTKMEPLSGVM